MVGGFSGDVPQRNVERGDGIPGNTHPADPTIGAEHLLPQFAHHNRVLAHQQGAETPRIGFHRLRSCAAEDERVAQPVKAAVGMDAGDHQTMLGKVQGDGLGKSGCAM